MSEAGQAPDAAQIKELGWKQGAILPEALCRELRAAGALGTLHTEAAVLVVISHDCDVTNDSLAVEPRCELLAARIIADSERDGSLCHGRNPRRLQLALSDDGRAVLAVAHAGDRALVAREWLLRAKPDRSRALPQQSLDDLVLWLTKRYTRAAFPDQFNERTRGAQKAIRAALRDHGHDIREIFLAMGSWDELPALQAYQVTVVATMGAEEYADPVLRRAAQRAIDTLEQKFSACAGIKVLDVTLASEEDVSLADLRLMKRLDFDYMSPSSDSGEPRGP
jgi:hypothetical protein